MQKYRLGYIKQGLTLFNRLKALFKARGVDNMNWETYTDSIRRHRDSYKMALPWLTPSATEAHYSVVHDEYDNHWSITFWHGNRGHRIGNEYNLDVAKQKCESHLQRMYREFTDQITTLNQ